MDSSLAESDRAIRSSRSIRPSRDIGRAGRGVVVNEVAIDQPVK